MHNEVTAIYESTNPQGYETTKEGKVQRSPGICAGMTAVWCLKMGMGINPNSTKPGLAESTLLQFNHAANYKNLLKRFFPAARLKVLDLYEGTGSQTGEYIVRRENDTKIRTYFWGYPGHAIGAAVDEAFVYLFDPDEGMLRIQKPFFTAWMKRWYPKKLAQPGWLLFEVIPDRSQAEAFDPKLTSSRMQPDEHAAK
ncbi:MAG: hypothetical protein K9L32_00630 [Chromatiaceae bacterium]|nr:hypothetical protein [Chromatiaceae bacterium]MCF8002710.1 hypothetical protein [Chromatiaceae bacterium]